MGAFFKKIHRRNKRTGKRAKANTLQTPTTVTAGTTSTFVHSSAVLSLCAFIYQDCLFMPHQTRKSRLHMENLHGCRNIKHFRLPPPEIARIPKSCQISSISARSDLRSSLFLRAALGPALAELSWAAGGAAEGPVVNVEEMVSTAVVEAEEGLTGV